MTNVRAAAIITALTSLGCIVGFGCIGEHGAAFLAVLAFWASVVALIGDML